MSRFAPVVCIFTVEGRRVLWHGATGRHFLLSPPALAAVEAWTAGPPPGQLRVLVQRMDELALLAESLQPDLAALIPCPSRLVIRVPEPRALWLPVPDQRGPGGYAYRARPLDPVEDALWAACNGARSVAEVAARAGAPLSAALAFFATLTGPEVQALQLRDQPAGPRDPSLRRLVAPERPDAPRPDHLYGSQGQTTLGPYHHDHITDGQTHFDDRETTVAHAFARPHPALGGLPYGARLLDALLDRSLLNEDSGLVVEVGPGTGELAEALLGRALERGRPIHDYLRIDASPALLATQDARLPGTRGLLGEATALPLADHSVGFLLSNEVLADLEAAPEPLARPLIAAHGLHAEPGQALFNVGAWRFVAEIARVLRPGAAAVLTEFGDAHELPSETRYLDHPEVSIHFGQVAAVARAVGLDAQLLPLGELLQADLTARWLARGSHEALRSWSHSRGQRWAARARSPQDADLPAGVTGLDWVPITEDGPGPVLTRFMALVLRQPDGRSAG